MMCAIFFFFLLFFYHKYLNRDAKKRELVVKKKKIARSYVVLIYAMYIKVKIKEQSDFEIQPAAF